jgi:hypothetical protein
MNIEYARNLNKRDLGIEVTRLPITPNNVVDMFEDETYFNMTQRAIAVRHHFVARVMENMMTSFQEMLLVLNRSLSESLAAGYESCKSNFLDLLIFSARHARNGVIGHGAGVGLGAIAEVGVAVVAPQVLLAGGRLQEAGAAAGVDVAAANALKEIEEKLKEKQQEYDEWNHMKRFLLEVVGDSKRFFEVAALFADTLQQEIMHFLWTLKWGYCAKLADILTDLAIDGIKTQISPLFHRNASVKSVVLQLVKWARRSDQDATVLKKIFKIHKMDGKLFKVDKIALQDLRKCYATNLRGTICKEVFGYLVQDRKGFTFSQIMHLPEGYCLTYDGGKEFLHSFVWMDSTRRKESKGLPPRVFVASGDRAFLPTGFMRSAEASLLHPVRHLSKLQYMKKLSLAPVSEIKDLAVKQLNRIRFSQIVRSFLHRVKVAKHGIVARCGPLIAKRYMEYLCSAGGKAIEKARLEIIGSNGNLCKVLQLKDSYQNEISGGSAVAVETMVKALEEANDGIVLIEAMVKSIEQQIQELTRKDQYWHGEVKVALKDSKLLLTNLEGLLTRARYKYKWASSLKSKISYNSTADAIDQIQGEIDLMAQKIEDSFLVSSADIKKCQKIIKSVKTLCDTGEYTTSMASTQMNALSESTADVLRVQELMRNEVPQFLEHAVHSTLIWTQMLATSKMVVESRDAVLRLCRESKSLMEKQLEVMNVLHTHEVLHPVAFSAKAGLFFASHYGGHALHVVSVSLPTAGGFVCTTAFPISLGYTLVQDAVLVSKGEKSLKKAGWQFGAAALATGVTLAAGPVGWAGWGLFAAGQGSYYAIEWLMEDERKTADLDDIE